MTVKTNDILAFIPQNNDGELALQEILHIQQTLEMRLFVLNIINAPSLFIRKFQLKKLINLKKIAEQDLNHFIGNVIQKKIPENIIPKVKIGGVLSTLIKESKLGGYEFIAVDKNTLKETVRQKKMDKLISLAYCPVLILNSDFQVREIKNIIIPIDISLTTKKRLYWATLFAKKFGAKIKIVSALNIDMEETKSLAYKNADKIKNMLVERGIECEVKIIKVHGRENHVAVLKYIEEEKPELVIIRTHQDSIFSGKKIGKFVSTIVNGCNMPVLTVNYSKELP